MNSLLSCVLFLIPCVILLLIYFPFHCILSLFCRDKQLSKVYVAGTFRRPGFDAPSGQIDLGIFQLASVVVRTLGITDPGAWPFCSASLVPLVPMPRGPGVTQTNPIVWIEPNRGQGWIVLPIPLIHLNNSLCPDSPFHFPSPHSIHSFTAITRLLVIPNLRANLYIAYYHSKSSSPRFHTHHFTNHIHRSSHHPS